jgi:hypothetical protein
MLLLESATFALGDDAATKRIIETETDLIRHRTTEYRRRIAAQELEAKRLTKKKELPKKPVRTVSMTE